MTTGYAAPAYVEPAPRAPLPFGLFSVLALRPDTEARWIGGVEWQPLPCEGLNVYEVACDTPINPLTDGTGRGTDSAVPFMVVGNYKCDPIGNTLETARAVAEQNLLTREEAAVELTIWAGGPGDTAYFMESPDVLTPGPVSPVEALGLLEKGIASVYGSLGVIHMDRAAATAMIRDGLLTSSGSSLKTLLGTPVVAGAGYPGTGPGGVAGTWAVATPALFGYRTDILPTSSAPGDLLNRARNDLVAVAQRMYLVGWDDCGVAAAELYVTPDVP